MGAKFKVIFVEDENGKPVRKFVPENDERPGPCYAIYGDYLRTDKAHIQETKDSLLESLFDTLRNLSENEDFWIVKEIDGGQVTVGWKIHIPQMDEL